ncbi:hypothetical protein AWQ21_04755 [Picosynechococcus sp. PCC 7003]|uniref:hypothetical protein n=1 Tax=Picosynechococcus sp. PCC 7003 TaxID=374981 RepID=UPI000810AC1B|nr:hypothetical protein [Picosynechococcus sp. PCC 7003]ANV83750.1 hypothetical protein AWQ21_04755 [Picosynechococcus sp. PCC 7003]
MIPLVLFFVFILVLISFWMFLSSQKRIKAVQESRILSVKSIGSYYSNFPLANLGIVISIDRKQRRIKILFPKLTTAGDIQYIQSWHNFQYVQVPDKNTLRKSQNIQELATLVQEHLQLEIEIEKLTEEWKKIKKLSELVSTSEFYSNRQETCKKALFQVKKLLKKADQLEQVYVRFIREILIGYEISGFDFKPLTNEKLMLIDSQHKKIKEEYQDIKNTAIAYAELIQTRQI